MTKLDSRFSNMVALVEATNTEQFFLWKEFHTQLPWEHDPTGFSIDISESERPITLSFSFIKINMKRVCFWECISQLQDYEVIFGWIEENLPKVLECNAINFHQAVHEVYGGTGIWPTAPVVKEDLRDLITRANKANQDSVLELLVAAQREMSK